MIWVRHCNIAVDNLCRLRNIQTRAAAVVATCHPRLNYNICNKFVSVPIPKGIPVAYRKMRILWYWREISYLMIWYRISSVPCNYPIVIQYVRRLIDPNLFADYKRDMDLRYRSHKIWITRANPWKMFGIHNIYKSVFVRNVFFRCYEIFNALEIRIKLSMNISWKTFN